MESDSIARMKELYSYGNDIKSKKNVSETVEYKVSGPNGKTYGIVRESQKFYIKESINGDNFEFIGGIGNKNENEYSSYNSAYRNLELKIREMNTSQANGKIFEAFKPAEQSEYIIEATEQMRESINRQREIMSGASKIMKESNEFINKPKFKDPEGFGTATDPKKQGEPFQENPGEFKGDKDPKTSTKKPKDAGAPFETEVKPAPEKMDIEKTNAKPCEAGKFGEPAKDVLGNSVAAKKPSGGKVFKVTESQLAEAKKRIDEGFYDDFDDNAYSDDEDPDSLLNKFNFDVNRIPKYKPTPKDVDNFSHSDEEEKFDTFNPETDLDNDAYPIEDEYVEESTEEPFIEDEIVDEGFGDNLKAVGSAAKYVGSKAANSIKQGAKNMAQNVKQKVQNVGQDLSQQYNKSMQNTSTNKVAEIASNLKAEIDNLNARTVKAGGQPLNYQSVLSTITNQLIGNKGLNLSKYKAESVEKDNLVKEITEAVLNAFGDHPTYQKAAFTTPSGDKSLVSGTKEWDDESVKKEEPYGKEIGDSAPFTEKVSQKVGEGEIGVDNDSVSQGKTPQGKPSLGKKGDEKPFDQNTKEGSPISKGEKPQGMPKLGEKGDKKPFDKGVKESFTKKEFLDRLTESIISDLKKK